MTEGDRPPPILRLWRFGRVTADVNDEIAFHLEMRERELIARGSTPSEARATARHEFGDVRDATTYCRRTGERRERRIMRTEWLTGFRQDVTIAVRTLLRAPAFTLVALLTLALGIGANTAIFSVVNGILFRPLPFRDPSRIVMVPAMFKGSRSTVSAPNAYDWRDQNRSFSGMAVIGSHGLVITANGLPERLRGYDVGANFFDILGVVPVLGRLNFSPEEAAWHGPKAVVISEATWRTRFGADQHVVGTMITLDNERYQVIGVAPASASWPNGATLWLPFSADPEKLEASRGAVYLSVVARLKPGVTLEAAKADISGIMKRLAEKYPDSNRDLTVDVVPLHEWITGNLRTQLLVLLGGVAFVLLIACANVANLLLVRSTSRGSELAVRAALGAGRGRLLRQLLTESTVLSVTGGLLAIGLAMIGTRALVAAAPSTTPRLDAIHVDATVLTFTLAIAVVIGIVFGLIPARAAVRPDLASTLREGGRGGGRRRSQLVRQTLVVAEVALSVMLLAGAGLLIRSFGKLMAVDPGFRTDHSISFGLSLPRAAYGQPETEISFVNQLMPKLQALPGVQSVGAGSGMPLTQYSFAFSFEIAGHPKVAPADQPFAEVRLATPDYFPTMGIAIVKGRNFAASDRSGGQRVLLLTETAAAKFFPGEDPIGKHVTFGWGGPLGQLEGDVVGIVSDVKQSSLANATLPQFWAPYAQWPVASFNVILHTSNDPQAVIAAATRAVHDINPDLAVAQVKSLDQVLSESVAQPRFYMSLLTVFAVVALLLSAIGIYGVIAYLVGQRSREIGIRIALGAGPSGVVRLIVREALVMIAIGLAVGMGGALALTRLMKSLLFNTESTDAATYGVVLLILAGVGLAAAVVPALKAARVDPVLAMRAE